VDPQDQQQQQQNADVLRAQTRLAAIAALRAKEIEERERYARDPWAFFSERIQLLDPLNPVGQQVAPYPDFAYTKALVGELQRERQLIVWKSRRMIMSWSIIDWFVYLAAHFKNQRLYLISRVEGESAGEGARELIWRAGWTVQNLRPGPTIRCEISKLQLVFPDTGSTITGMGGNEPNKMRQMAANAVFCDEFGFWDKPEEAYTALKPTMEGRGQVIIACSTASGFFKQIVLDESESWMAPMAEQRAIPKGAKDTVTYVDGMDAWTNSGNGFRVIKLLFWADPRKQRGTEWEAQEKKGMTERAWNQEMLCKFHTNAGTPIFKHEWNRKTMIVPSMDPDDYAERPLIASLDFGYNRPAMVVSVILFGRIWRVLRALMGHHIHFTPFMRQCQTYLAEWFPHRRPEDILWCCDIAGRQVKPESDPEIDILRKKFGIRVRSKYSKIQPTIDRMRDYMTDVYRQQPCFQVERHPSTRIVIEALDGGWAYPEAKQGKPEPDDPDKDGFYEHIGDCLRYTILNFGGTKLSRQQDLAALSKSSIIKPHEYVP
jgi:hypothetical protein